MNFNGGGVVEKIDGISILVGTAECNARCHDCAGRQHRKNASEKDGEIDEARLREVLDYCLKRDCRYITLTGSGEPTLSPLSVTATLEVIKKHGRRRKENFAPINLYTNGIRLGTEPDFAGRFLPTWKELGLTTVYISVYSIDEDRNAIAFGIGRYPRFEGIFHKIKECGLKLRTSIILKKGYTDSADKFRELCERFFKLGVDNISAWPLKDGNDYISAMAPSRNVLEEISELVSGRDRIFPDYPGRTIRLLLGDSETKENLGKKIALFQDGTVSDVWCARK